MDIISFLAGAGVIAFIVIALFIYMIFQFIRNF